VDPHDQVLLRGGLGRGLSRPSPLDGLVRGSLPMTGIAHDGCSDETCLLMADGKRYLGPGACLKVGMPISAGRPRTRYCGLVGLLESTCSPNPSCMVP
jgi:hypothetical protein